MVPLVSTQSAWRRRGTKNHARVSRRRALQSQKQDEGDRPFDISAKGYRDYVLTDPDYPLIPGTNVERLRLVHLGPKAAGVSDDEIRRVVTGLEDWYATKAAAQRATGKKNPPKNPPQLGEVRR